MSNRMKSLTLVAASLGLAAPVLAQGRSTVTTADLETAVTAAPTGSRQQVRDFLARPDVRDVANRMGSASKLAAAVETLDQASLDKIAAQTVAAERQLAGGANTIVITTTTIIIALLIIILLTI